MTANVNLQKQVNYVIATMSDFGACSTQLSLNNFLPLKADFRGTRWKQFISIWQPGTIESE